MLSPWRYRYVRTKRGDAVQGCPDYHGCVRSHHNLEGSATFAEFRGQQSTDNGTGPCYQWGNVDARGGQSHGGRNASSQRAVIR